MRRRVSVDELKERVPISLKLPKILLDKIDEVWRNSDDYTGRTHFIEKACSYYLSCEKCPECGNLNSIGSNICSRCETKLSGVTDTLNRLTTEIQLYDKLNENIFSLKKSYDELNSKIEWLCSQLTPEKKQLIDNILSENLYPKDNPIGKICLYQNIHDAFMPNNLKDGGLKDSDYYDSVKENFVRTFNNYYSDNDDETKKDNGVAFQSKFEYIRYIIAIYCTLNHDYFYAKSLINTDIKNLPKTSELVTINAGLVNLRNVLYSLIDELEVCLSKLKNIEKMIVYLIQQPNP